MDDRLCWCVPDGEERLPHLRQRSQERRRKGIPRPPRVALCSDGSVRRHSWGGFSTGGGGVVMGSLWERMIRAAKLDASLYEEVEADRGALGQATAVVVLASLAAGFGSVARGGVGGFLFGTIAALAGWYVWAFFTYLIGTPVLPEPQT